ncbi:MAG: hypothetical protein LBJ59_01685, partial [Zoogloeaceae bacterium]|nr:hypothetical protein [Zoogloeaceae bacterium]
LVVISFTGTLLALKPQHLAASEPKSPKTPTSIGRLIVKEQNRCRVGAAKRWNYGEIVRRCQQIFEINFLRMRPARPVGGTVETLGEGAQEFGFVECQNPVPVVAKPYEIPTAPCGAPSPTGGKVCSNKSRLQSFQQCSGQSARPFSNALQVTGEWAKVRRFAPEMDTG